MPTILTDAYEQGRNISTSALISALLDRGKTTEQIIRELTWKGRKVSAGLVRAVRHQLNKGNRPKKRRLQKGFRRAPREKPPSKSERIRELLVSHPELSNQQVVDRLARQKISVSPNLVRQVRHAEKRR